MSRWRCSKRRRRFQGGQLASRGEAGGLLPAEGGTQDGGVVGALDRVGLLALPGAGLALLPEDFLGEPALLLFQEGEGGLGFGELLLEGLALGELALQGGDLLLRGGEEAGFVVAAAGEILL